MREESEYEEARRLLAPLSGEPTGPSTVDIRRAVADGRRRVRMRRVAGVGAAAVVGVLVAAGVPVALDATRDPDRPSPVAASGSPSAASPSPSPSASAVPALPTQCELDLLPEPDGAYQSLVTAADPTGRFIAGRSYAVGGPEDLQVGVLIWDDGEPTPVDLPGLDPRLTDLNSSGVGVGVSYAADDMAPETGWVYQDGQVFRLPGDGVSGRADLAINEHGVIVGVRSEPRLPEPDPRGAAPLVWQSPTSEPEELSSPGLTWDLVATDVDGDGTVVGSGVDRRQEAVERSFVWLPDGARHELPVPMLDGEPASGFRAETIHDGVVTGWASRQLDDGDGESVHVVRYDLRTGEFTTVMELVPIHAVAWNRHGWVAGEGPDRLALWTPSAAAVSMPDLGYPATGADSFFNIVKTLSDDGRVAAGQVDDGDANAHAARWRCE